MKPPYYRWHPFEQDRILIERVVGEELIDGFDPLDDWGWMIKGEEVAVVNSREAALAVMRMLGEHEFHDWTEPLANWDMPFRSTLEMLA